MQHGVGTVTFYEPSTKTFGALGHGITDIDTNGLINIASGEFITTKILNITKGEIGKPGKIQGTIENQKNIGKINKNTKFGIYGTVEDISSLNIITDQSLINKTGGIIQGMSGSPITQNGKFIGAVTHVLVNNPEKRICSIWGHNVKTG